MIKKKRQNVFHTSLLSNYGVCLNGQWQCFNLALVKPLSVCLGVVVSRTVYK